MEIVKIRDLFEIDFGGQGPLLLANNSELRLICEEASTNFGELKSRSVINDKGVIEIKFIGNDFYSISPLSYETFSEQPYYNLGMKSICFYELLDSDLIIKLKNIGKLHHSYNPNIYNSWHHYVIPFEEQLFECISKDFEINKFKGSIHERGLALLNQIYNDNF